MTLPEWVSDDLRRLVERMWLSPGELDWPVSVTLGAAPVGYTPVEEYVVVPHARAPRFLIPVGARAASRAAFTRQHTTSSRQTRLQAYALAGGFGSPVGEHLAKDRLVVAIDPGITPDQWSDWLLVSHLRQVLGTPELVAYHPVRRATPNAKPTLRLFDRQGRPHGYAKVGWSAATRAIVDNEARTMAEIAGRLSRLHAPALVAHGGWQDHRYLVAAPLPAGVKAFTSRPSITPDLLLDVAASGDVASVRLRGSRYAEQVRRHLEAATALNPRESTLLLNWLARLEALDPMLDFGRWHGDWVPWNLGRTAAGVVAWDWEYSDPHVPLGFDLVHWHFQRRLAPRDATLAEAVAAADAAAPGLATLSVAPSAGRLVVSLYLLEMFTRAVRLAAAGAGWNPKLHPELLEVAGGRDR